MHPRLRRRNFYTLSTLPLFQLINQGQGIMLSFAFCILDIIMLSNSLIFLCQRYRNILFLGVLRTIQKQCAQAVFISQDSSYFQNIHMTEQADKSSESIFYSGRACGNNQHQVRFLSLLANLVTFQDNILREYWSKMLIYDVCLSLLNPLQVILRGRFTSIRSFIW